MYFYFLLAKTSAIFFECCKNLVVFEELLLHFLKVREYVKNKIELKLIPSIRGEKTLVHRELSSVKLELRQIVAELARESSKITFGLKFKGISNRLNVLLEKITKDTEALEKSIQMEEEETEPVNEDNVDTLVKLREHLFSTVGCVDRLREGEGSVDELRLKVELINSLANQLVRQPLERKKPKERVIVPDKVDSMSSLHKLGMSKHSTVTHEPEHFFISPLEIMKGERVIY